MVMFKELNLHIVTHTTMKIDKTEVLYNMMDYEFQPIKITSTCSKHFNVVMCSNVETPEGTVILCSVLVLLLFTFNSRMLINDA